MRVTLYIILVFRRQVFNASKLFHFYFCFEALRRGVFLFNPCMFCFLIINVRQVERLVSGRNGISVVDLYAHLHAKSLESSPNLCDPMDYSPLGSPVHGILQARTVEQVAISFSRGSS